jgi:hypothetical protein
MAKKPHRKRDINMTNNDILNYSDTFKYQLLSRLKSDCDYYLNYGNRNKKALWAGDEIEQILVMKQLWNSFSHNEKPEWLTWNELLDYEKKIML